MGRLGGALRVAAVGKLKEPFWRAAQDEYLKRLGRYADFKVAEVRDRDGNAGREKEGQDLLAATADCRRRVALTPEGRALDSVALAGALRRWLDGFGRVAFLIGGPEGLSREVRDACDERLSLSPLTFPHEMARVVLLEQLYRAATILGGEKYHK